MNWYPHKENIDVNILHNNLSYNYNKKIFKDQAKEKKDNSIDNKTEQPKNTDFRWPALLSDNTIFNQYFHECGMPHFIGFNEIYSLNYQENNFVAGFPVFGIIAAIKRLEYQNPEKPESSQDDIFFVKQTEELDLACGLIAVLNILGNKLNDIYLEDQSILKKFFEITKYFNPEKRSKFLEDYNELKEKHKFYSAINTDINLNIANNSDYSISATSNPEKDGNINKSSNENIRKQEKIYHFISFALINRKIYEFDGLRNEPKLIKELSDQEQEIDFEYIYINYILEELESRVNSRLISDNLSLMYLTYI